MKLNNKGFTVVELLSTFALTMVVTALLFEIVLELKNVYVNSDMHTIIKNENALVANEINKHIHNNNTPSSCSGNSCTLLDGKKIEISSNTVKVGNKNFKMSKDAAIEGISTEKYCETGVTTFDNCYLKISYKVTSSNLKKEIPFNLVLTYAG